MFEIETFGLAILESNKCLVSKEIVVLRQWESETYKFGFIKRIDKGRLFHFIFFFFILCLQMEFKLSQLDESTSRGIGS